MGEEAAVHWTESGAPQPTSACIIFAVTEADTGGLPNGARWLPTRNITQRLLTRSQELGFSNVQFCLIVGGASAGGRTAQVGANTVCGTPAELTALAAQVRSIGTVQDMATPLDTQLRVPDNTCAGQDGFVTVILSMLPVTLASSDALTTGSLARAIADANGAILLLGGLNVDNSEADSYLVGYDYQSIGYEGNEDSGRVVQHPTGTEWFNEEPFLTYGNMAHLTGGALFDSTWLTDADPVYLRVTEMAILDYFSTTLQRLRSSRCAQCQCASGGQLNCGLEHNVIRPELCRSFQGMVWLGHRMWTVLLRGPRTIVDGIIAG